MADTCPGVRKQSLRAAQASVHVNPLVPADSQGLSPCLPWLDRGGLFAAMESLVEKPTRDGAGPAPQRKAAQPIAAGTQCCHYYAMADACWTRPGSLGRRQMLLDVREREFAP